MSASTAFPGVLELAASPEPGPRPTARGTRLTFTGAAGDFLHILLRGTLLLLPTFGFYRFWLTTRLRRHLWAHTSIGDEAFEYTGTGKELLIGFLIAMAILVPINLAYFALAFMIESLRPFGSLPLFLVLYGLGQYGAYRARRYRATRTVFRGLRFWMTGSAWGYAVRAVGWGVLCLLTVGLALPWASADLERYKMRRTRYGTLEGDFSGTGWQLAKRTWHLWLIWIAATGASLLLVAHEVQSGAGPFAIMTMTTLAAGGVLLLTAILYPFVLAAFAGWMANGIRFGSVAVHSSLRTRDFFGTYLKLLGMLIALGLAFAILLKLVGVVVGDPIEALHEGDATVASMIGIGTSVMGYLATMLSVGILNRYFMVRGLWTVLAASITLSNVSAIDDAVAAGEPTDAVGEGLGDALDFGGGL